MRLLCPHCQRTLEVPDSAAGKQVRCPACSTTTRAPAADGGEPAREPETASELETSRPSLYDSPPPSSPLSQTSPTEEDAGVAPAPATASGAAAGSSTSPRVACPKCAKSLLVTPAQANQIVACPACHARLRMPSFADAARGVPAKLAFGMGQGAEVQSPWATPIGATDNISPPVAATSGSATTGNPYLPQTAHAPLRPVTSVPRHSEPILYILPGAFQLTMALAAFMLSIFGIIGAVTDIAQQNDPDAIYNLLFMTASVVTTGIVIAGSIQMIRRRSLLLARTASILAIIPCNMCCVILMPFGIWSTIMLFLPNATHDFQ